MDFNGISSVLTYLKFIVLSMPAPIYECLKISFWIFVTLSVIRVVSYKEN